MKTEKRKMIIFDIIYSAVIAALLIELFLSGAVSIGRDAAVLTLSIGAALIVVLILFKRKSSFIKQNFINICMIF